MHGYGTACAGGSGGEPKLTACGVPAATRDLAVLAAGGVPSGTALLFVSPASANLPLPGGCTALVDVSLAVAIPLPLNPVGQAALAFRLPPGVSGLSLYAQLAPIDSGAANGFFALSRGLRGDLQ